MNLKWKRNDRWGVRVISFFIPFGYNYNNKI